MVAAANVTLETARAAGRTREYAAVWEEKGRPDMLSHAKDQVQKILEEGKEGILDLDVISQIKEAFPGSRLI